MFNLLTEGIEDLYTTVLEQDVRKTPALWDDFAMRDEEGKILPDLVVVELYLGLLIPFPVIMTTSIITCFSKQIQTDPWNIPQEAPKYKYDSGSPSHNQLIEGLGYVPGVCSSFLGLL